MVSLHETYNSKPWEQYQRQIPEWNSRWWKILVLYFMEKNRCSNLVRACSKIFVRMVVRRSLFESLFDVLVRSLVRGQSPKMPGPCTRLVRGLVRRLFVACTSTLALRAHCCLVGPVRPCTKWLYEALRRGLFKGLCEVRLNNHWTTQFRCGGGLFERLFASCYTAEVGCSKLVPDFFDRFFRIFRA